MPWGSRTCSPRKFEMIDAIWCVLMYYFDQIKFLKSTIIYYKNIDYSYTPGYTLVMGDAHRDIKKNML